MQSLEPVTTLILVRICKLPLLSGWAYYRTAACCHTLYPKPGFGISCSIAITCKAGMTECQKTDWLTLRSPGGRHMTGSIRSLQMLQNVWYTLNSTWQWVIDAFQWSLVSTLASWKCGQLLVQQPAKECQVSRLVGERKAQSSWRKCSSQLPL